MKFQRIKRRIPTTKAFYQLGRVGFLALIPEQVPCLRLLVAFCPLQDTDGQVVLKYWLALTQELQLECSILPHAPVTASQIQQSELFINFDTLGGRIFYLTVRFIIQAHLTNAREFLYSYSALKEHFIPLKKIQKQQNKKNTLHWGFFPLKMKLLFQSVSLGLLEKCHPECMSFWEIQFLAKQH